MGHSPQVWYTSDLHIGHKLVALKRGFWERGTRDENGGPIADTAAHDLYLATTWEQAIHPLDTVYVLGDISINGGQHALDWIAARPGTKHLIVGNHDPVHPMYRTATKLLPHWSKYFETIQPFMRRKLLGQTVLLSHFPYESWGDGPMRPGSRHNQYRLPDHGEILVHGHTHGVEKQHGTMFHVGVDAWGLRPVNQDVLIEWMTTGVR